MRKRPKVQRRRIYIHTLLILAVATSAVPALAQRPTSAQASALRQACRGDYEAGCGGVATGGPAPRGGARAAAAATVDRWPHAVTGDNGSALVYQPQVIAWPDRQKLETRIAMAITPKDAKSPAYGTVDVPFSTSTSPASRSVTLPEPRLV